MTGFIFFICSVVSCALPLLAFFVPVPRLFFVLSDVPPSCVDPHSFLSVVAVTASVIAVIVVVVVVVVVLVVVVFLVPSVDQWLLASVSI